MIRPSLFLSHGAPTLPLTDTPARAFLKELGGMLPRPKAILVVSAHWETAFPTVSAVERNDTIHDFGGFPRALYELQYPAAGSPRVAARVFDLLRASGFDCKIDHRRGLDHGAWVPLLLMYPQADIPVLQLSIQPHLGTRHHLLIGHALAPLRDEGVLIIGSGSMTHDLSEFRGHGPNDPAPDWVNSFADWFHSSLTSGATDDLLDYRRKAPFATKNHPTEEHLLPLYAALGAAGAEARTERLHASSTYSILRMDVYAFKAANDDAVNGDVSNEGASAKKLAGLG
ncbi:DODA-type extradiol aromatic ring-opening family dioxygenase [Bradyrhizobium sp.]|uniref:DODA-type extradiol aromatic ring-opening family dioxygenase n=1 Tax=Bradyrhizobium sp. TaxID=376 RepID=UPI003C744A44